MRTALFFSFFAWVGLTGCAGYQIGQHTLYRSDLRTVHVPMFGSDSFRRNLGERLTEAVVREIEENTPYKIVPPERADSILVGRIVSETKKSIAEDTFDNPRVLENEWFVQVQWTKPNGEVLGTNASLPIPFSIRVNEASHLIPEAGQSITSTQQKLIEDLARHIVAQMEVAW